MVRSEAGQRSRRIGWAVGPRQPHHPCSCPAHPVCPRPLARRPTRCHHHGTSILCSAASLPRQPLWKSQQGQQPSRGLSHHCTRHRSCRVRRCCWRAAVVAAGACSRSQWRAERLLPFGQAIQCCCPASYHCRARLRCSAAACGLGPSLGGCWATPLLVPVCSLAPHQLRRSAGGPQHLVFRGCQLEGRHSCSCYWGL